MKRRTFISALAGFASVHAGGRPLRAQERSAWTRWKTRFLEPDGRVVDRLQGNSSHSEGQGYGLLLAQAFGDRAAFFAMEDWTRRHLLIRDDPLMAWKWRPIGGEDPDAAARDWFTATDGDLFRAWALLRAEVFSGWGTFGAGVGDIVHAIAALCLKDDPRAPGEPILIPGAEAPASATRVLFNPSYIMPRALRELGDYANVTQLIRAADHGETLLAELAMVGLVPDWTVVTKDGFEAPEGFGTAHGYDAFRVALFLHWSGRSGHPALRQKQDLLAGGRTSPVVLKPDGSPQELSDLAGYAAVGDLINCRPVDPAIGQHEPYYPATLGLLARVARRESGLCEI